MTKEEFYQRLAEQGFELSDSQKEQFERYFELLVEWNEKINLTAITEKSEVYLKHFYDSVAPVLQGKISNEKIRLLDIGAGAGFPSLPMKILCPEIDITIIDSLNKRINFLNDVITSLGLEKVHTIHARAEDGARSELREAYDIAVSRAVANLSVLLEYTLPYVKVGGCFVSYKSGDVDEELKNAENALKILGGSVLCVEKFELPENGGLRSLVFIKKTAETPSKYPRKAGKPTKNPL